MSQDESAFWREQGIAAARLGDRAGANAALERAVQLNPADEDAWFWLAAVQSEPRRSLLALERVLALNPRHERALAGQAAVRAHLGLDPVPPPAPAPVTPPPPPVAPAGPPAAAAAAPPAPSPFANAGAGGVVMAGSGAAPPAPSPFAPAARPPLASSLAPPAPSPFGGGVPASAEVAPAPAEESLEDLGRRGIAAAQAGRRSEARAALLAYVERDERNADAWYWLSTVMNDPRDIQVALENTLQLNPNHSEAAQALRELQEWHQATPSASGPDSAAQAANVHNPFARQAMLDPGAPDAWAGVTVGAAPTQVADEYEDLVGQILGRRYRVVALFPSHGTTLLLATDIRNGHYILLRPEREQQGSVKQSMKPAFVYQGVGFVTSNLGLGGISLRNFLGTIGRMPAQQAVDYGLRLIQEARRGRHRLLERRTWSPDKITIDQDGALDLSAPDRVPDGDGPYAALFSPPEHHAGGPLDERSDVYLIGALVFFLVTGAPPPAPDKMPAPTTDPAAAGNKQRGRPRPVATFAGAPDLPPYLAGALATAMQPDPAARYQSLAQFEAVLQQLSNELRREGRSARLNPDSIITCLGRGIIILVVLIVAYVGIRALVSGQGLSGSLTLNPFQTYGLKETPGPTAVGTPHPLINIGTPSPAATPEIFATGGVTAVNHLAIDRVDPQKTPQVTVYFSVLSKDQRPVGGLTNQDFAVTSDKQPVTDFQIENLSGMTGTVATFLVMETGARMEGQPLDAAKAAAAQFVQLLSLDDRTGLITYDAQPHLIEDLTITRTEVLTQIDALTASGASALYDALYLAAQHATNATGQASIVLLSDGQDTASQDYKRSDVVQYCILHSIPIHVIGLNTGPGYDASGLLNLATATGGLFFEAPDPQQLVDLYRRLAFQIQGQYRLTFSGVPTAGNHQIGISTAAGTAVYSDTTTYQIR